MNPIIARRTGAGALAAALAFPAAAAAHGDLSHGSHGWFKHHGKFLAGTVSSVDAGANQVTVKLGSAGTRHYRFKSFSGEIKLTVNKVKGADRNGDGQVTLADVAAGDKVLAKVRNLSVAQDGTATGTASKLYDRGTGTSTALSRDESKTTSTVKSSDDSGDDDRYESDRYERDRHDDGDRSERDDD